MGKRQSIRIFWDYFTFKRTTTTTTCQRTQNLTTSHRNLQTYAANPIGMRGTRSSWLGAESMPADVLTKPLSRELHEKHTAVLMGVTRLHWDTESCASQNSKLQCLRASR